MWRSALAAQPDEDFAKYILDGLEQGFRIGFSYDKAVLLQYMPCPNPEVVTKCLSEELQLNQLVKLTKEEATRAGVHFSPIGTSRRRTSQGSGD